MTRYHWAVKLEKNFIGREALIKSKPAQAPLVTVGLMMQDRIIPRTGYPIQEGGYVTSGTLSPLMDKAIAMALVKPEYQKLGTKLMVMIREKPYLAEVVRLPFLVDFSTSSLVD